MCTKASITESQPVYWSYSHADKSALSELNKAREQFGELIKRSSEPDLIVVSKETVFWIEAKLNASNNTRPGDPSNVKKYLSGGGGWFQKVFSSPYQSVAIDAKRYELTRLWLLGSWMAADMGRSFVLIDLTKQGREEHSFQSHIVQNHQRSFLSWTWEELYQAIKAIFTNDDGRPIRLLWYLENKSVGYDGRGRLIPAFSTLAK